MLHLVAQLILQNFPIGIARQRVPGEADRDGHLERREAIADPLLQFRLARLLARREVNDRHRAICARIAPMLKQQGLMLVGLELGLLIGVLAGLASIVPYMGFVVGIGAAVIAALFQFGLAPYPLIGVAVVFTVGQMLEGMLLTPLLVGDRIGLHPVAVIFAVLAGGQLFGFTGVLLALPVAAVIMVLLRHVHDLYKLSDLYAEPAGAPAEPPGQP